MVTLSSIKAALSVLEDNYRYLSYKYSINVNDWFGSYNVINDRYNLGMRALLDKHRPLIQRVVTVRRHAPWYTESLRDAKRRRRAT